MSPRPSSSGARPVARSRPGPDDLRRTFEAVPARTSGDGEPFADSWWGRAWVAALESLSMDAPRLDRGRAYADSGNVAAITVTPGQVVAYVHGSRPRPYRAELRLRTLTDPDWDTFLDAVAARPGHLAALLAKEVPHSLADTAAAGGITLLPAADDLDPGCSCPDRGWPCKHVAALCYQMGRLLDADPFVLLLLRGRGERELLEDLGRRNAAHSARERPAAPAAPSVPAREALADRFLPPLPAPFPVEPHPGQPPSYPEFSGARDPLALDQLATDAAARAHALLTTGLDPIMRPHRLAGRGPTGSRPPHGRTHRHHPRSLPRTGIRHRPQHHRPGPGRGRVASGRSRGTGRPGDTVGPPGRPLRPSPPGTRGGGLPALPAVAQPPHPPRRHAPAPLRPRRPLVRLRVRPRRGRVVAQGRTGLRPGRGAPGAQRQLTPPVDQLFRKTSRPISSTATTGSMMSRALRNDSLSCCASPR